jgi:hypothetical protein
MNDSLSDNQIKLKEIQLKELELKSNRLIAIVKTITTGVVVTLVPAIINYQIQQQEVEIKRLEGEIVYLDKFSDNVVEQEDLAKRKNFVEYLATIAHSKESRQRWNSYLAIVEKLANKQAELEKEILEAEQNALESQQALESLTQDYIAQKDLNENERRNKQAEIAAIQDQVKQAEAKLIKNTDQREQLIKRSSLTSDLEHNKTFFVGLQTVGIEDATRTALNKRLESQNYRLDPITYSYSVDEKPSWFAAKSTVFYYSSSSRKTAERLAKLMKRYTRTDFAVQRGAGLGVDLNRRENTFFIHYIK